MVPRVKSLGSRGYVPVLATLLVFLGIGVRLSNLGNVSLRSPDEQTYTYQAGRLLGEGISGVRALVADYRAVPERHLYPPPSRTGYLWLLAGVMKLTGRSDAGAGAYLSCAASIGSLLLLAVVGARFFPPWAMLLALLFFAISPVELALSRRAWGDALLGFSSLALTVSPAEITRSPRSRLPFVLFACFGGLGITIKETGYVVFGLCLVWASWVLFIERKKWREGLTLVCAWLVGVAVAVSGLSYWVGGYSVLLEMHRTLLTANAANAYVLEYQTGPWYHILLGLFIVAPLSAIASGVGLTVALASPFTSRRLHLLGSDADRQAIAGIAFGAVSFLALPMILPHWVSLRFLSVMLGAFYLLAGLGLWFVGSVVLGRLPPARRWVIAVLAGAVVLTGASADYRFFRRVIVQQALPDLTVRWLLGALERKEAPATSPAAGQAPFSGDDLAALEDLARRQPTPETYLSLSLRYHQRGRYQDCITAGRQALKLRPGCAAAHNNITAAYQSLRRWDEAIEAASQALQYKPDFPLARNNLRFSRQQKLLEAGEGTARK